MSQMLLLSPAGNMESLRAAVENGADCVYMGLNNFNARVMANNFSLEEYIGAIKYCHIKGVKVYLTLNTLVCDDEIEEAIKSCINLYEHGLDGVIVQDYGIASLISKCMKDLPIHASTQMSVHSLKQVKLLEKLGFKRVVLARELTIAQIENICKNTKMEIEVFIHGALCTCYSGQCLMSSMIGVRSGNRGSCAQPCRMRYTLLKDDKKIVENKYILSRKDICGIEHIGRLKNAGVHSLKIEGRNKSPEYVATVTSIYRKMLDYEKISKDDKKDLLQIFNRSGISYGYFDGVCGKEGITLNTPKNTGLELGKIIGQKGKFVNLILEQDIDMHDGIEIYTDSNMVASTIVTCIKDDKGTIVNKMIKNGTSIWLGDISEKIKYGSIIYKTSSNELNNRLKYTFEKENVNIRKNMLKVSVKIKRNENIIVDIISLLDYKKALCVTDITPQVANKRPITKDDVVEAFSKTVDEPFEFSEINCDIDDFLFLPMSKLNDIRKNVIATIKEKYEITKDVVQCKQILDEELKNKKCEENKEKNIKTIKENSVYIYKYDNKFDYSNDLENIKRIYFEFSDVLKYSEIIKKYNKYDIFIAIPNVVETKTEVLIDENIEQLIKLDIKGFLVGNIGYVEKLNKFKKKYNIITVADYSLNIMNSYSAEFFKSLDFDEITLSPEIGDEKILELSEKFNVSVISENVTVMTSRYCIIGSFIGDKTLNDKCSKPCLNGNYYLQDTKGEKYRVISNNIDSIMKLIKSYNPNYCSQVLENISIRKNI